MKKAILVLLLLGAGGALAWFFAFSGGDRLAGGGEAPRLGRAFDAEQTVMLAGVEGLDGLARETARLVRLLPAGVRAQFPPELMDPKLRAEKLGFDPMTAEGWKSIGIDPRGGAGFALDARFATSPDQEPAPVLALAVTDRERLLPALKKLEVEAQVTTDPIAGDVVVLDGDRFLLGRRGDFTVIAPISVGLSPEGVKALRQTFDAYLKGGGRTLAEDATFRRAFREIGGAPRSVFYAASAPGLALLRAQGPMEAREAAIAQFYVDRFPGLGVTFGPGGGGVRLLADDAAVKGLRQVIAPKVGAPAFSRYVPRKGAMVLRFSLNLAELFDGVVAFVPPELEQAKGQILLAKNMLPLLLGAAWEDVAAGYSGHFALATTLPGDGPPRPEDALLMAGVADPAKADVVLDAVLSRAVSQVPGAAKESVEVLGNKGFRVTLRDVGATIVRVGDVVIAATDAARLEAALERQASLKGTAPGAMLDGEAVFGFAIDVDAITAGLRNAGADVEGAAELWQPYAKDGYLLGRARLDEHGLLFGGEEGGGAMVALLAGVGAAVAVPAFVQYVRRAKTAEAALHVHRIHTAVLAYHAEHRALPPAAPLTPVVPFCAQGDRFAPDPAAWQQPGWQALRFSITEPHVYKYELAVDATGFTARAVGDLDCDGVLSTFERGGTVTEDGAIESTPLQRIDEME